MKSILEQCGGTYRQEVNYLIPNIELPENKPVGKYGRLHGRLYKHRIGLYSKLLLEGKLNE